MAILLIIYFLFIIGFITFSFFGLYHLWKFGFRGDLCKIVMITYVIISGIIIVFSLLITMTLNWSGINFPDFADLIPDIFRR